MSDEEAGPRSLGRITQGAGAFLKRNPPIGAQPGALAIPADSPAPKIHVIAYSRDELTERDVHEVAEIAEIMALHDSTWVDVQGLGSETTLLELGELFGIHPLALADVVNVPQRPKTESYEKQQLFICNMIRLSGEGDVTHEQVSLFIGQKYLLTFQENYGDVFEPIRKRLREGAGMLRASGADYLAYALIDTIVDAYYPVLEAFADELDELEERVMRRPRPAVLLRVHAVKRTLLLLRRAVWPLRDALSSLLRDPVPLVTDSARLYLRDTYDHCIQLAEMAESYRELVSELTNTHLSVLGNRTNEVMRVLTVVTTVFIPLTFIVGVYGMNFDYMPELRYKPAYFIVLGLMLVMALLMLVYFRRRGWLGDPERTAVEDDAPKSRQR
jgi:magnesium transporter